MKLTPLQYAAVLTAVIKDKTPVECRQIAGRLFRHLLRARTLKHRERIVREAGRIMRTQEGVVSVTIESAAPLTAHTRRAIGHALGKKTVIAEIANPRLLGGVRVLIDEETLIDATASRRLATLFQL